jgi:hypothetical protein
MSANIQWEPLSRKMKDLPVMAPQAFIQILENAGLGNLNDGGGIVLKDANLPTLRGMMAVFSGINIQNPYWHLIKAIEQYGEIRVWAVY